MDMQKYRSTPIAPHSKYKIIEEKIKPRSSSNPPLFSCFCFLFPAKLLLIGQGPPPQIPNPSPPQLARAVLVDQALVIRPQRLDIRQFIALGIQIKLVEFQDPISVDLVRGVLKLAVLVVGVPRVERVVADDEQTFVGNRAVVALQNVIHVLCGGWLVVVRLCKGKRREIIHSK